MKRRQIRKGTPSKTLSSLNSRCVSQRTAHVITRCPLGTGELTLGGGGAIGTTGLGGFAPNGSSSVFEILPINLGWVADFASHFAYWKLHQITLMYTPRFHAVTNSVGLATAGTAAFGIADDPANIVGSSVATLQELRSGGEFELDRKWSLSYKPTGQQAVWQYCTSAGSSQTGSNMRLASAGQILCTSSAVSTSGFYSQVVGRLELIYECSFKGAVPFRVPSISLGEGGQKTSTEEKKSLSSPSGSVATAARTKTAYFDSGGDYELVEVVRSARR
jgi:hypothetical protein